MTRCDPIDPATDCISATILGFLLPFFLAGAGGNQDTAKAAIRQLIDAYDASTPAGIDLAGRIVGFSIAAMDNLRLSMRPDLSDTKVLRCRTNAVTLSRASDQARKLLEALQAGREVKREIPRPAVAAAPPPAKPLLPAKPLAPAALLSPVNAHVAREPNESISEFPMDIETMKRDARIMMAAFSKNGGQSAAMQPIPDSATLIRAAARAAVDVVRRTSAA